MDDDRQNDDGAAVAGRPASFRALPLDRGSRQIGSSGPVKASVPCASVTPKPPVLLA
jgi:hypothetical protein